MAQGTPDYDFEWARITHAGNRGATVEETRATWDPEWHPGSVGHEYRLAKTELAVGQWVDFLNAYRPYMTDSPLDPRLRGAYIAYDGTRYSARPHTDRYPQETYWRYAAMYCNWLHNGKVSSLEAFADGAYDTSTFTQNPDGSYNDAPAHRPGATFWIPTRDEWIKAGYYDPNRYGTGVEGYWWQLGASDVPLISGLPGDGGQTNGGRGVPIDNYIMNVGSYPALGPWGLFDMSGNLVELTETIVVGDRALRFVMGSAGGDFFYDLNDRLDGSGNTGSTLLGGYTVRIAGAVPEPAVLPLLTLGILQSKRRRT
jgi:formylglycine-generating enzyme required for sulfatase activity